MCYFLYGAINEEINKKDYDIITLKHSDYCFLPGTRHDIQMSIEECSGKYRITHACCDCDTPLGQKDHSNNELKKLAGLLTDYKSIRNVKYVYMSKNWTGNINRREITTHIDDIEILDFLANFEEDCLYRINLYPKHY